ncbi:MAG: ATP-grasp domain-containing protein, partial [Treponemataceae bacterium]|nr:ATP-grasp domain-containing protein [Treponemataceae bacterium]
MRSVLLLGAGLMQRPAILAAKRLGCRAVVVDGNPAAVCAPLADRFVPVDLKDRDALAALADSLRSGAEPLAAVFTAGTDFSANVAFVAERCGLRGHSYQACLNASDKARMRRCFAAAGVPSPGFRELTAASLADGATDGITYPQVIKPVDNMGGRGCRLVRDAAELRGALDEAVRNSRSGRAILEDVMDGAEYSIDAVVWNGTLTITGLADRHICYPPYFIEMGHTMPSSCDEKTRNELIATFALGIQSLGLTCGVAKADIKYTAAGPMVGEIAARLS